MSPTSDFQWAIYKKGGQIADQLPFLISVLCHDQGCSKIYDDIMTGVGSLFDNPLLPQNSKLAKATFVVFH